MAQRRAEGAISIHSLLYPVFFVCLNKIIMEKIVNLHIEKMPEGFFLATSNDVQGLIAQGRTLAETIEIARDVAKKLIEAQEGRMEGLISIKDEFDFPVVIGV